MSVYLPNSYLGYGGASYGFSTYGSTGLPRPPVAITGGFGGSSYSYSSYGSSGYDTPRITYAISMDGFVIRVYFSTDVENNASLVNPAKYLLTAIYGVDVTILSIEPAIFGELGVLAVDITHTGTTLGGNYHLVIDDIITHGFSYPFMSPNNEVTFYTLGDRGYTVGSLGTLDDGRTVNLNFFDSYNRAQPLLTESDFTPGVDDVLSYDLVADYPIDPVIVSATQDQADLSLVVLDVDNQTSLEYELVSGPALSIDYKGDILPQDSTDFTGVEFGVGSSTVSSSGLFLSKTNPNVYGYEFLDTSGRLLPNSSFRIDFSFDFSQTTINPPILDSTFATFEISDGVVGITLNLKDVGGYKAIEIISGTYTTQVLCEWDTTTTTISLLRNQKADVYTLVCENYPQISFPTTSANGAPTISAGCSFTLLTGFDVSLLKLTNVYISSSQTLFTNAWNFIHQMVTTFVGSSLLTNGSVKTKRGPLTRGWGDNTPAEIEDVAIKIDGVEILVGRVNPYLGVIYPLVPIPLFSSGTHTITVDYKWFKNPQMNMVGLNTSGLNLNTWDRSINRNTTTSQPTLGVTKTNRFPMGIALGPSLRSLPKEIGYKYIGFQNDYSALLNSEHLLLLNKNPNAISEGNIQASAFLDTGVFNGQDTPTNSTWDLFGIDDGYVNGDGTYTLVDNSSGSFSLGYESIYYKETDLSLETIVTTIGRFRVDSYQLDGVFTGVGIGLYDGSDVGLLGCLLINGVQHLGLLTDGSNPHLQESWELGFSVLATGLTQNIITVAYTDLPQGIESGNRLVIYNGSQIGIYTIDTCGLNLVGNLVEITLKEPLPVDVNTIGQNKFTVTFETKWDTDLVSVRMSSAFPQGTMDIYVGGDVSGLFLENQSLIPYPAQTSLLLPNPDNGVVFWGSISRKATNTSTWDLVQYVNSPIQLLKTLQGKSVSLDMNTLPQDSSMFYLVGGFGAQQVNTGLLTLNTDSSSQSADTTNYYETVEPYLSNKTKIDISTEFKVDLGNSGYGDLEVYIEDGSRRGSVYALRYYEDLVGRYLVKDTPTISLSGLLAPQNDGWTRNGVNNVETVVTGQTLNITKGAAQITDWNKTVSQVQDSLGCVFETELDFNAYTLGTSPFSVSLDVKGVGESRTVVISWEPTQITVSDGFGVVLITHPMSTLGKNTYRLVCDPQGDVVSLFVNGTLQGTTLYSNLMSSVINFGVSIYCLGNSEYDLDISYMFQVPFKLHPNEKRTLGLLKRDSTLDNIDSYVIPRTDGTQALNSSLSATPFEQDFTSTLEIRLLRDPTLGLALYLPNELMPNGQPYVPSTEEVSNAWAYVDYRDLPLHVTKRAHVGFGSVLPQVISNLEFNYFNYTVKKPNIDYGVAPQGMVLNRATTLTSGEYNYDITLEDRTFFSRTDTLIYVPDSGIYASRVFKLIVGGVVLASTDYSFDRLTQYIVLNNPLTDNEVRVIFNPSTPITKTYLCSQPINQTVTVLNEGTPLVPTQSEHYSDIEVCTDERGDTVPITTIDDNGGLHEIGIDGHFVSDNNPITQGVGGTFGKSGSIINGTSGLHQAPAFHLSGGSYQGMVLPSNNIVNTMLYPNVQGQQMGMNQTNHVHIQDYVEEDTFGGLDDNVPPTYAQPVLDNPNGTPGTYNNGAVAYQLVDYASTGTDRLGPYGGLSSLTSSLLGGSVQLTSELFVLNGGNQLPSPSITEGVLEPSS